MIFIGMNHPKHFWMFKEFISILENKSISYKIFVSSKDVLEDLLKESGLNYILLGNNKKGIYKKISQLFIYVIKMVYFSLKYKPKLFLGQALPHFAFSSVFFFKSKFIILEDTEHVTTLHKFVVPFSSIIYTPKRFPKKFGEKQKTINAIYELLYLHPKYFKAQKKVLLENNISPEQPYAVIRLVSWNAHHDINKTGISLEFVERVIKMFKKYNIRPYITSEKPLPNKYSEYILNINKTAIHQVLYFSSVYIGEGATMAAEASLLGTPSIYINEMNTSFCKELAEDYNLMYNYRDINGVISKLEDVLIDPKAKLNQKNLVDRLVSEMDDPLLLIKNDLL